LLTIKAAIPAIARNDTMSRMMKNASMEQG
jgi:hypothetical protein